MMLYGKKSILERLNTNPASIIEVFTKNDFDNAGILNMIREHNLPIKSLTEKKLKGIKSSRNVQGIIAKVVNFEYTQYEQLLSDCSARKCCLIFLDGINDPHNLGVIIRTLACFGGYGLVLPANGSCEVNDTVLHVAVGGENYLPISIVENLSTAVSEAKSLGIKIFSSVVDIAAKSIYTATLKRPLGIVFGSEHSGISKEILDLADEKLHIPTPGAALSLNINIACAIACSYINNLHRLPCLLG